MVESEQATQLLNRWRAGDEGAATELFELYAFRLKTVAQQQMSAPLARRVDGEDIVQSAFRTFFRRGKSGEFTIDDSAGLWRLLVKITLAKVRSQARRHTSQKRDIAAEQGSGAEALEVVLLAQQPGPDEVTVLVDLIGEALTELPATYVQILAQRLSGTTRSEIAQNLGISRQTVYRALNVIGQRCEDLLDASRRGS